MTGKNGQRHWSDGISAGAKRVTIFALTVAVACIPDGVRAQPIALGRADAVAEVLLIARDAYTFLHSNPELGNQEVKAHEYLTAHLRSLGFAAFVDSISLPTAVVAVLDTGRPGRTIALRAELDARPVANGDEPLHHDPRSLVPGVMHTCGHDVHAAILLAVAQLLRQNISYFSGRVVFLFQPAEEIAGGADDIVREGILERLGVEAIFAQHVASGMPVGTIAVASGDTLAGSSYFRLQLSGRPSHAAVPFEGDDVAINAMKIAIDMSEFPARRLDISNRPAVVSITSFNASSGASNVLPESASIRGTIRSYEDPTLTPLGSSSLRDLLVQHTAAIAAARGLVATWEEFRVGSPPTRNSPALFQEVVPTLIRAFPGTIDTAPHRSMFSEDFAYYTHSIPALYVALGIAKAELGLAGVHTPEFTVHPDTFAAGIMLMTMVAEVATTGTISWR